MAARVPQQLRMDATLNSFRTSSLVDTGAAYSCVPKSLIQKIGGILEPTPVSLSSCTGESIPVHGEIRIAVGLKRAIRRSFEWNFIVADVSMPIIGLDFLSHFGMILNCAKGTITDQETNLEFKLTSASQPDCQHLKFDIPVPITVRPIFDEYNSVLRPTNFPSQEKVEVKHCIKTIESTQPPAVKARRLVGLKLDSAKRQIDQLLKANIIRPSDSPYASPIHMVPKGNDYRVTGDYRQLNAITVPDRYPSPHLFSFADKLKGAKVFSKLDITSAFHHIPVNGEDIQKTAITTPFGLYEYMYMPFGLRNAPSTFQRFMDQILKECRDFAFWKADDILIASKNKAEHRKHLMKVLEILDRHNLTLSLKKSQFEVEELVFMGHHVSEKGIHPTTEKTEAILNFKQPESYADLRRYLGMLGFYRRMIPHFTEKVFILSEMVRLQPKAKHLEWSLEAVKQFEESRKMLSDAVCLPHPSSDPVCPYHLVVDASSVGIGGALHQCVDGESIPIGFFSKKLSETQRKYSTYDRELLAAYLSVLHFKDIISGLHVILFSDHKPLVSAFKSTKPGKTDRQERYWTVIAEYVSDIQHIRGADNIVADCMSRPVFAVQVDAFDFESLAEAQKNDTEMQEFISRLKPHELPSGKEIFCDISTTTPRPFVPESVRDRVFEDMHNLSHPGVKASLRIIKARYFWPNMDSDIRSRVKSCLVCQQTKVNRHTKSPLMSFQLPVSQRFQYVHIDLVGPLPPATESDGTNSVTYRYLLTAIDRATRWVEAIPLVDMTAQSVATAFLKGWISRFGVPLYVCTDQGRQFESELFRYLSELMGFSRLRTSAYHPQSNGFLERIHRTLKTILKTKKRNWLQSLPIALLGLRAQPNSETGISPFTFVTGTNMLVPPVAIDKEEISNSNEYVKDLAQRMSTLDFSEISSGSNHAAEKSYVPEDLKTCSHVWLRIDRVLHPLEAPYQGPFEVVERNDKNFNIRQSNGKCVKVSVNRLKPVVGPKFQNSKTTQKQDLQKKTEKRNVKFSNKPTYYYF